MRAMRASVLLVVFLAVIAPRRSDAQAIAGTQGTRLSWVRAEGAERCPDAAALEARIRTRMGRDPFHAGPVRIIEGVVRLQRGQTFSAHITLRDADGNLLGARDLTSNGLDCSGLVSAAAVTIALSLSSAMDEATTPASDETVPAPASATFDPLRVLDTEGLDPSRAARATRLVPSVAVARTRRLPWPALHDSIGVTFHAGLLPLAGAGVALGTEMRLSRFFGVALSFTHLPVQQITQDNGTYSFGMTYAEIDACIDLLGERTATLGTCVGLASGGLEGVFVGSQIASTGERFWLGAAFRLRATVPLYGPLEAALNVELIAPLLGTLLILPDGSDFRQSPVAAVTSLGLGVRFP